MLVYFLMRTMDFMAFLTRLVAEDLIWLKDYLSTLTSWHCIGFFALCLLYILIMRFINYFLAWLIKWLISHFGISNESLENLSFKLTASNPKYSSGYKAGYKAGCEYSAGYRDGHRAGRNYKEPSWWDTTWLNPANWFN